MFGDDSLFAGVSAFGGGGPFGGVQTFGGGGYVAPTPAPQQTLVQTPYTATQPLYTGYRQPTQIVTNPALQPAYAPPATNFMSNYLGPNTQAPAPAAPAAPSPAGGADLISGNPFANPAGGASLADNNPFAGNPYGSLSNSAATGGAGLSFDNWLSQNGWSNDWGDTYSKNAGGGDTDYMDRSNLLAQYNADYGNLSGNPFSRTVNLGYQPPSTGVRMPTTAQTYGDLSGVNVRPDNPFGGLTADAATGGANLSANNPLDLANYQNAYRPPAPTPPPRPASLDTGGAGLQSAPPPINTAPQNPAQPYRLPTTASTFGDLSGVSGLDAFAQRRGYTSDGNGGFLDWAGNPMSGASMRSLYSMLNPTQTYQMPTTASTYGNLSGAVSGLAGVADQSYMDAPQGSYGSLLGADDMPSTTIREGLDGRQYPNPPQPISTAPQNPPSPLPMPTSPTSAASSPPVSAGQIFAQGVTPRSQQYAPAYGDLARTFDLQGSLYAGLTDKNTDRVPQTGGFTSYGAIPSFDDWLSQNGWSNINGDTFVSRSGSGRMDGDTLRSQYGSLYRF